jgi:hypothetical protein
MTERRFRMMTNRRFRKKENMTERFDRWEVQDKSRI